jgi:signal transduction histidine kinase
MSNDPLPVGARATLNDSRRAHPAAILELSQDGVVRESNGRLEKLVGRDVVGRSFADLLDTTSREKWRRLLERRDELPQGSLCELVFDVKGTMELRRFTTVWGRENHDDVVWLIENADDEGLEPLLIELGEANTELVDVQRNLAKERSHLNRVIADAEAARIQAERASSRLQVLHAVSSSVLATHTQEEIAQRLLKGAYEALAADTGAVLLLKEPADTTHIIAIIGGEAEAGEPANATVNEGFVRRLIRTRSAVIFNDPAHSDIPSPYVRSTMMSVARAPIFIGDRVIGAVRVGSKQPNAFDADDLRLLELVARDIGVAIERTRLLGAERAARAQLERAVRVRDEVLAVVAHDLRNPLARISTTAALLAEESLAPEGRAQMLAVIRRSSHVMERLIRDLLDVARLEGGRLPIERRSVSLDSIVRDAASTVEASASDRGILFETRVPEERVTIDADAERLQQVIGNLLDNALRVTPNGGRVTLEARRENERAVISVADTGPGIAAEDLPHLFEGFWQGTRQRRGTAGLGLAIAKGIVDAHDGRISVKSAPGKGATFEIALKVAAQSE